MNLHNNFDREFDRSFAKMEKSTDRLFILAVGAWILYALVYLAVLAGIIYVAAHFIGKFW